MRTEQREKERAAEIEKETSDAIALSARGNRAARFLKDDFWVLDLEPMLAKIQIEAEAHKGWAPSSGKTLEEYALSSAYYSAVEQTVGEVLRKIKLMIAAGDEAEAYLNKSAENTK